MFQLFRACLYFLLFAVTVIPCHAQVPSILLAQIYHDDIEVADYLVSEKLDGIRAYWDGQQFISRQGHLIHAPSWFSTGFPHRPLDGELWIARGRFEQLSSTVRQSKPDDAAWRQVAYYVFELPDATGDFSQRVQHIKQIVREAHNPYLKSQKTGRRLN